MRLPVAAMLAAFAGCTVAGDPSPPIDPGPQWGAPVYDPIKNDRVKEDLWNFGMNGATLIITKQECSPCKPIGQTLIQSTNKRPNDVAIMMQNGNYPAEFSMSTEARGHLTTSFGVVTDTNSYGIHLTVDDDISARESMRLQQELLRMMRLWELE